jgi:hypothetical protein
MVPENISKTTNLGITKKNSVLQKRGNIKLNAYQPGERRGHLGYPDQNFLPGS